MSSQRPLVILGAGVIGLTIANLISTDPILSSLFKITIVARDLPQDLESQAWASPWAGANWSPMPMGGEDERIKRWETTTFNKFWDMIPTGLVMELPARKFIDSKHAIDESDLWWKDLVRNFRIMNPSEVLEGCESGISFTTLSVNPAIYLPWLVKNLEERGVEFLRKTVKSLDELSYLTESNGVVINATSLGSRSILGIADTKLYPIRGQVIIVRCPGLAEHLALEGDEYTPDGGVATYIIPRPGEGDAKDTVLLGGTFEIGNWDTSMNLSTSAGIFERCAKLAPCLYSKETEILRHNTGLRPAREGGPRVEAEKVQLPLPHVFGKGRDSGDEDAEAGKVLVVVHAYGFAGAGYQESWGAAEEAVSILKANI